MKNPAAVQLGRKGGKATFKKRGKAYMAEIGKKGRAKQLTTPRVTI